MSIAILRAILTKDLRSLGPMAGIIALLFLGNAVITRLDLLPDLWAFALPMLLAALVVLCLAVFQNDSPASLTDDWLCRPVPLPELLTAKLALVVISVYLPSAIGAFVADLTRGFPVPTALLDAVLLQDEVLLFLVPVLLFIAVITRTLVQGFGVLFAIFIAVFVAPTPFVREPGPLEPGIRDALLFSGMRWLSTVPAILTAWVFAAIGFWLVYWRRRLTTARVLLVSALGISLLCFLMPMALLPWHSTFALQKAFGPRAPVDATDFSLRSTRVCLPATRRAELLTDAAFVAATHQGTGGEGLKLWEDEALQGVGPDSIAFLTEVEARGLPLDWRVRLNYVQAEYFAEGEKLYSLRPARYFNDRAGGGPLVHAWMLPESAVQRLKGAPAQLELTYYLTMLKPREVRLPTDGKRHALPGLGLCSAVVDEPYDRIDVECFGTVRSPAQLSVELNEVPASRVLGLADFAPSWARWPYSRRAKLAIGSPRLAKHESITVTAWDVAGYREERVRLPGILGADSATCPLPSRERGSYQDVRWRDGAAHQARMIPVEDGVQVEVLDFGGSGAPVLLLPGLGATAHSYDDFAPLLARTHRVVAMTRRGTGYSTKPDFGFETPRLAQDVLEVMRAMELEKVLLVGSSIAGEELTWLGGHHAENFDGLVYLDAAYDRSGDHNSPAMRRLRELTRALPPEPPVPSAALKDYDVLSQFLASRGHARYPEGELIAFFRVNSPFIALTPSIDARTQQAISAAIEAPDYARLKIPALALFAIEDPSRPLPPWYDTSDARLRADLAELGRIKDSLRRQSIEKFQRGVANGRVLEIPKAAHYLVLSHPQEVLEAIESFSTEIRR
jgi:pimeloyl-ACP methyl ester carboxylesterase